MELRPGLSVDDDFLAEFARGIRRIVLYGSALRDHFRPDSDIDGPQTAHRELGDDR